MRARFALVLQIVLAVALVVGVAELWPYRDRLATAVGIAVGDGRAPVETRRRSEAVPVVTARVDELADDLRLETVGTGRARRSITLKADAEGKILEMDLAAGRVFAAGAVMLRLDDTNERLALELAEAQLAEAERVFLRFQTLETQAFTSTARLTESRTAREIARIERDQAAEALEDRVLRAPFAGVAGLPQVEVGDRIDTDTEIASFDDRAEILIGFDLPEAFVGRIAEDAAIEARTPAYPGEAFAGHVDAIDSRIDPISRAARVRVAVPNEGDRLRPGASFTVTVSLPGESYPVVPELALQFAQEGPYVWAIRDGESRNVPVRLIRRRAGLVLVEGALSLGDAVAVEGVQRLREGRQVDVIGSDDEVLAEDADSAAGRSASQ
ncbi:MAG: efflux RND transporter periplasmic adaptor subunit [Pseudomonadota bacterium]